MSTMVNSKRHTYIIVARDIMAVLNMEDLVPPWCSSRPDNNIIASYISERTLSCSSIFPTVNFRLE
jgi:hypothetical protein